MKVVINQCFGGFHLSDKACEALIKRGWTVTSYNKEGNLQDATADFVKDEERSSSLFSKYHLGKRDDREPELRTHPDLVAVVKELGKKASASVANLVVIEIPDDVEWEIKEYDGNEWVAEKHRTWP